MRKYLLTIGMLLLLLAGCGKSPEEFYSLGQEQIKEKQFELALESFRSLIKSHPEDSLAPVAKYQIARIYLDRKNEFDLGRQSLKELISQYPGSAQAVQAQNDINRFPQWLHNRAESSRKVKNISASIEILEYIIKSFPENELASKAQYLIGDIRMNDLRDFKRAIESYRAVTEKFVGSKQEAHAQFMIGYIYANILNDNENAKKEYALFLEKFPSHELAPSVKFEVEFLGKDINEIPTLKHITS